MKCLVIKSHRQQARKAIQHARLVVRQAAEGVDRRHAHAIAQQRHVTAHIRHVVDLEQRVAVMIGKRQDAARTMVLEAARQKSEAGGSQRRGNSVARIALIFAAFESESELGRPIQPFPGVCFETMHHGAALDFAASGNPWRTASAGKVAMTSSRTVSRKTTNQKPDAMWHHHSYFAPGEPERLNT